MGLSTPSRVIFLPPRFEVLMFGVFPTHMDNLQVETQPPVVTNYVTSCSNVLWTNDYK